MSADKEKTVIKMIRCVVVSDKMQKSRVGVIEHMIKHKVVGKYIKRSTRIMFHDEKNEARVGDEVLLRSCRPMSAKKSFVLDSVVVRSKESV